MCVSNETVQPPSPLICPTHALQTTDNQVTPRLMQNMDRWLDYLETQLDPYLAGAAPMAADFYLFMITRWAPDKDRVRSGRPKIAAFIEAMRYHPIVESVNLDREKPRGA